MWRFGWIWQVIDSMCEDKHLLVFRCGGLVGYGRLLILCVRTVTYWYLDVEFGWIWQVIDSMCEDKHLLVFRCGGLVGSGKLYRLYA